MLIVEKSLGQEEEHRATKGIVLNKLNDIGQNYELVSTDRLNQVNLGDFNYVMSLGGDGTFLRTVKYIGSQRVIGVNSNTARSVGFLTYFNRENIESLLEKVASESYELEKLSRLQAQLEEHTLDYRAVNEILVSQQDVRDMAHLDFKLVTDGTKCGEAFIRSTGIIVSTRQGSNAFFKSSGATPFHLDAIGYSMLMPYSVDGKCSTSGVLDLDSQIEIINKRNRCVVSFDCDKEASLYLEQGEKIVVSVDHENPLNIIK